MIQIFKADDPRVLDGTYDVFGYTPKERAAQARKERSLMVKRKKAAKPRPVRLKADVAAHRVNTIPGNGSAAESREVAPGPLPIGEAMRQAVEALGARTTDEGLSAGQLAELADCSEAVARAQAAYDRKAGEAKIAKKSLESATALLIERVRTFTHAAPLPLFDARQAEADRDNMLHAAELHVDQDAAEADPGGAVGEDEAEA